MNCAARRLPRCRTAGFAATVISASSGPRDDRAPIVNKPSRSFAKPLRDLLGKVVGETFTRQGFASAELVTRWTEIVGAEIAAHSEPIKIQWPHGKKPACGRRARSFCASRARRAIEIQHLANVICERVNRFLGWRAIERIALRQAPLRRAVRRSAIRAIPPAPRALPPACRKSPTMIYGRRLAGSARRSNAADTVAADAVTDRTRRVRRRGALADGRAGATFVPQISLFAN